MNTRPLSLIVAVAFNFVGASALLFPEGPLSTGVIKEVSREKGTLILRSEQNAVAGKPLVFSGMDKANILTPSGKVGNIEDLKPGVNVTVFYAKEGNRWIVSKVLIPDQPAAPVTPPAVTVAPLPRAAVDGDITTEPGKKSPLDNDITKKAPNSAATDGDRTTVPAESRIPVHRRQP